MPFARIKSACLRRLERAGVQGDLGPVMNDEEVDPSGLVQNSPAPPSPSLRTRTPIRSRSPMTS